MEQSLNLSQEQLNELIYLLHKLPIEELNKVNTVKTYLNKLWDEQNPPAKQEVVSE
jgi:hypothetical protein